MERLELVAHRDLKGSRFALSDVGTGIVHAGPVVFIGHVVDACAHGHLVCIVVQREAVAHAQIQRGIAVQLFAVREIGILRARVVHACGGGQAVNWLDVVLCPQHGIEVRHANRIVALIHAVFGFGQLGLQPGGAGVQAHPEHGLAKKR